MSSLIAVVMLILLSALAFQWRDRAGWPLLVTTLLAVLPIVLAAIHTVPAAKRLGGRVDAPAEQSRLARSICRDHLICLALMSAFIVVWSVIAM